MLAALPVLVAAFSPVQPAFRHSARVGVPVCVAAADGATRALVPPRDREEMLNQAAAACLRAKADGLNRYTVRLFLPRGEEGKLFPPDESWQGGIMQLFYVCSPLVRDLLRKLSVEVAGVPPSMPEQRLDDSGVDGESVWFAQSSQPQDDAVGLVQPTYERMPQIRTLSKDAGTRPLLLCNPQWKERDDPLDALSRKDGFLGALGAVLGGKAQMEAELKETLGFRDVYTLAEYVCRGSRICLHLAYPSGWTASYRDDSDAWVPLLSGAEERPTYQEIEVALQDAGVPFKMTEFDINNVV